MTQQRQHRKHIPWLFLGLLLGGLLWFAFGKQPTAVPLVTLRFDDDNGGLGKFPLHYFPQYPPVQVDRAEKIHIITERVAKEGRQSQLQVLVLAPGGKVNAVTPLLRQDRRPLSGGLGGVFVVNPQGTRWWLLRHAGEDWDGKTGSIWLTVHGTDGRALQEWKMPIEELAAELCWLYAAGDNQVAVAWGLDNINMYIHGEKEPRKLNLDFQDVVMPNGAAWRYDKKPWDARSSKPAQHSIIYTPLGGKPITWSSFQGDGAIHVSQIIPSEDNLFVRLDPSWIFIPGIYRLSPDGQYTCIYKYSDMPQGSGNEDEEFVYGYPIYINRHGDHWRTSTSSKKSLRPLSGRKLRCTVWSFTKLPRWQIWIRKLGTEPYY